nr:unnamed protein product [Callosobruchus analis]
MTGAKAADGEDCQISMVKKKSNNDKREQENREKVKLRVRKYRQALKDNPEKYEEAKRRKEQGKIKTIDDLTPREQRKVRKDWRARSKKSYEKKHQIQPKHEHVDNLEAMHLHSTCQNTVQNNLMLSPSQKQQVLETPTTLGRFKAGKKRSRKNRRKLRLKIQKLKEELRKEKAKKEKYKKRLYRNRYAGAGADRDSPITNVERMIEGQTLTTEVKQALRFADKKNVLAKNDRSSRRALIATVSGELIKKYRFQEKLKMLIPKRLLYPKRKEKQFDRIWTEVRRRVRKFYENDDSSRICPGKKETITFKKVKKQKRYLNYSLKELHTKFCSTYPQTKISYSFFCRMRPFWVVPLNVKDRETCLCETHVNFQFLVSKLKFYGIIKESSSSEIIESITCSAEGTLKEACFKRECPDCKNKHVEFSEYNPNEHVKYEKWVSKKERVLAKGQEKICVKKVKETLYCNKGDLVQEFKRRLPNFCTHHFNMIHQYEIIREIKRNLSSQDVLIHMDFSENYVCKYSSEVQSAHFGGSKPQITLHTVVTYQKTEQTINEAISITSYCTLAKSLRHDPSAISAHLSPIILDIKRKCPLLNEVQFLSDGPSTQYKNKKMFFLLRVLANFLGANSVRWHYFESHHGKGAPDGIGGCVKRTADSLVARGEDIPNYETLLKKLQTLNGILVLPIDEREISEFDSKIPVSLEAFKGTMKVHEALWIKTNPFVVCFRRLSCSDCTADQVCMHYNLGNIKTRLRYEEVYSPSESSCSSEDELPLSTFVRRPSSLNPEDFVLVKIPGKKNHYYHYVAVIISVESENDYTVKYLRKSTEGLFYVFPDVEDIGLISNNDIVAVLEKPQVRRGQHFFKITSEVVNLR